MYVEAHTNLFACIRDVQTEGVDSVGAFHPSRDTPDSSVPISCEVKIVSADKPH